MPQLDPVSFRVVEPYVVAVRRRLAFVNGDTKIDELLDEVVQVADPSGDLDQLAVVAQRTLGLMDGERGERHVAQLAPPLHGFPARG